MGLGSELSNWTWNKAWRVRISRFWGKVEECPLHRDRAGFVRSASGEKLRLRVWSAPLGNVGAFSLREGRPSGAWLWRAGAGVGVGGGGPEAGGAGPTRD